MRRETCQELKSFRYCSATFNFVISNEMHLGPQPPRIPNLRLMLRI